MKPGEPQNPEDSSEEIAALIETLHDANQRLEQLTGGEVDTVVSREGRAFLLQHAQDQLRLNEAARQIAILNTLPASIALLDSQGTILSVNEAWQQFGRDNAAHNPGHDIGVNYLSVCDKARGDDAAEAGATAAGIRAVLNGKADSFALEYPCHSPAEQRWFQMTVTPLADYSTKGAVVMHLNITANKLAAKALRESEVQYRLLVGAMHEGVVLQDENAAIIASNRSAERILGLSADKLQGKTSFDPGWRSIHDDGAPFPSETHPVVQTLKTGIAQADVTMGIHKPNGELVWIAISAQPIYKEGETAPYRVVATMHDITERRRAEIMLHESEAEFHTLAEAMPQIVWITTADGQNTYFNQLWVDYTGLTLEESRGDRWIKPFHPDDRQQASDAWQKAIETAGIYSIESRLRRADGEYRWWLVRGVPLVAADGSILKWFGTCTDIHDLKMAGLEIARANAELRESEQRFSDVLGNVELVAMMLDREARVTYCNDYLLHLCGWKREEVIGKNWWDIFVPPEIQDLRNAFFNSLLDDQPEARHHENDIVTRSGERRLIRWNKTVLRSAAGAVTGIASIGEDITDRQQAELDLRHREAALAESQRITRIGSWEFTPATGVHEWSAGLNLVLARDIDSPAPAIEDAHQYYTPESWQRVNAAIAVTLDTGAPYDLELEMIDANGESCWTSTKGEAVRGADGTIVMLHGTVQDITDRREAEISIKSLNRVLLMLSSINTLIVQATDRDELFQESCNIAVDAGGFRMAMLVVVDPVTKLPISVVSAGKQDKLLLMIKKVLSTPDELQKTLVWQALRKNNKALISNDTQNDPRLVFGEQYTAAGVKSMTVIPLVVAGEAVGALALYSSEPGFFQEEEMKLLSELAVDISFALDHIEKRERLNYLAYYDPLTGLANRTLFLERVAQYLRSAKSHGHKLAMGLIDLERFKNINDSIGRPAGDALLQQVAAWLTQFAQDANLLARIDADHFAFVLPEVKANGNLIQLVDNFAKTFQAHPFGDGNSEMRLAAKTGIALFPDDGSDAETVYRNAEAALKTAKKDGERYLFHTSKMTEAVAARLTLENQLRQAIDNEEFVLHYQPKVNLVSGKVTSAEALIRWNDPLTGLVPPGKFIPVLEETGLILEVGRWAMRQAVSDWLRWRNAGLLPQMRIAVNVSSLQLRNASFVGEIEQVVSVDEHAADGLELEITESLIMQDIGPTTASIEAIRALGISIAIDDFGTGFSSLSYLARLPVDTLKIDRAFVIEMNTPEGMALVSTIIILAHALKLKVVAEGVETESQKHQLQSLGCDEMQGFLFSKPVAADIFEARFLASPAVNDDH